MRACARPAPSPRDRVVVDVAVDLQSRFPELAPSTVRAAVSEAFDAVAGRARYDAYLQILVARRAATALRSAAS